MRLIDLTCTKCGAQLQVNQELGKCICPYCGIEMLIDNEVVHHKIVNAYQAGYQAELGRQQALRDTNKLEQERILRERINQKLEKETNIENEGNKSWSWYSLAFSIVACLTVVTIIFPIISLIISIKTFRKEKCTKSYIALALSILAMLSALGYFIKYGDSMQKYRIQESNYTKTISQDSTTNLSDIEYPKNNDKTFSDLLKDCYLYLQKLITENKISPEEYSDTMKELKHIETDIAINPELENEEQYIARVLQIETSLRLKYEDN